MTVSRWGEVWQQGLLEAAAAALPPHVHRFFMAGAGEELTAGAAPSSWSQIRLRPHVLRDVRRPDLGAQALGRPTATPIGIAPTSMQRWAHPDGELAMARAAAATDTVLVVSTNAGTRFAELAETGVRWWLQAYLTAERSLIEPTLRAAVDAGASGLVLTVDTPFPGPKHGIDHEAFGEMADLYGVNHPELVRGSTPGGEHARDLAERDLHRLQDLTGLPLVVKGVLRGDEAIRCVRAGASAVWVSNHGGRQLDRSVATATALREVVSALEAHPDQAEVYVDGGIRSGLDVLTALACGAHQVFCGRLPLLALTEGEDGVAAALTLLRDELRDALALAGCASIDDARDLL